jgi:hypothetical protein
MQLLRLSAMSAYSRRAYEGRKLTDNLAWFPQKFSIEKPRQRFSLALMEEKTGFKPYRIHDILLQAKGSQTKHNFSLKNKKLRASYTKWPYDIFYPSSFPSHRLVLNSYAINEKILPKITVIKTCYRNGL